MSIKIIIAVFFIVTLAYFYRNFIINISPSEPLGIYKIHKIERTAQIKRGDIVVVCLPFKYQEIGLERGYLLPGIRCDKTAPLIKTVIAVPGDTVILKNNGVTVNGKLLPYATKYVDSHRRKLDVFTRGVYKDIKTYWLIGTNDPNSWDSKYWGGVGRKNIVFTVEPFFCFSIFPLQKRLTP